MILIWALIPPARADTIYLKNGRRISGVIKSEDENAVELEVSGGAVKFRRDEIKEIEKASVTEAALLRQKWDKEKKAVQQRMAEQKAKEESQPKTVEFSRDSQSIYLSVLLNKKVEATMILDTGASLIMLRRSVAEKLGIDLERVKPDMKVSVADGRQVNAKHIVLESVKAENSEAENVDAAILLDEVGSIKADGLLGMSFLKHFNFKIDHKEKRLILEKL